MKYCENVYKTLVPVGVVVMDASLLVEQFPQRVGRRTICTIKPHDLCPLYVCSVSLPHSLHLYPVSGAGLEGGQSVGGVTVGRLGDIDRAILGGVGHSEGVALGVAS